MSHLPALIRARRLLGDGFATMVIVSLHKKADPGVPASRGATETAWAAAAVGAAAF